MKLIWKVFLALFLVVGAIVSILGFKYYRYVTAPNISESLPNDGYFYVPTDAQYEDVVELLKAEKILLKEASFRWVSDQKNYTKNVKPGRYQLTPNMSNNELVNLLRSGDQKPVNIAFHSIKTLPQLAGVVSKKIEPDSSELAQYLLTDSVAHHFGFNEHTFIAMFIPNTYEFYWNTSPEKFVSRMAKEFKGFWTTQRIQLAKSKGLSQSEVSTLASIVQAETVKRDEMPKVAGLYLNRLKKGMRLQADPTVKYAVGDPTMKRIYLKHLKTESPYNTYIHTGLPPGPISVPEHQALLAVLNADSHGYIYMCAKPDYSGYHNFSKTLQQHNVYRQKYIQFLRKEGIR
jgi:UPF0755 protein